MIVLSKLKWLTLLLVLTTTIGIASTVQAQPLPQNLLHQLKAASKPSLLLLGVKQGDRLATHVVEFNEGKATLLATLPYLASPQPEGRWLYGQYLSTGSEVQLVTSVGALNAQVQQLQVEEEQAAGEALEGREGEYEEDDLEEGEGNGNVPPYAQYLAGHQEHLLFIIPGHASWVTLSGEYEEAWGRTWYEAAGYTTEAGLGGAATSGHFPTLSDSAWQWYSKAFYMAHFTEQHVDWEAYAQGVLSPAEAQGLVADFDEQFSGETAAALINEQQVNEQQGTKEGLSMVLTWYNGQVWQAWNMEYPGTAMSLKYSSFKNASVGILVAPVPQNIYVLNRLQISTAVQAWLNANIAVAEAYYPGPLGDIVVYQTENQWYAAMGGTNRNQELPALDGQVVMVEWAIGTGVNRWKKLLLPHNK